MITDSQKRLLRHWFLLVVLTELVMLAWRQYLPVIYLIIAWLFLAGFLLRIFKLYPGKTEPLILDSSAVGISLLYAYAASLAGPSEWCLLLIFTSSLIILPHLIFILNNNL